MADMVLNTCGNGTCADCGREIKNAPMVSHWGNAVPSGLPADFCGPCWTHRSNYKDQTGKAAPLGKDWYREITRALEEQKKEDFRQQDRDRWTRRHLEETMSSARRRLSAIRARLDDLEELLDKSMELANRIGQPEPESEEEATG